MTTIRKDLPVAFYRQLLKDIHGATVGADTGGRIEHYAALYASIKIQVDRMERHAYMRQYCKYRGVSPFI